MNSSAADNFNFCFNLKGKFRISSFNPTTSTLKEKLRALVPKTRIEPIHLASHRHPTTALSWGRLSLVLVFRRPSAWWDSCLLEDHVPISPIIPPRRGGGLLAAFCSAPAQWPATIARRNFVPAEILFGSSSLPQRALATRLSATHCTLLREQLQVHKRPPLETDLAGGLDLGRS